MPARLAMALVLAAWKPWAANSFTAASMTCSRRSSELARCVASRPAPPPRPARAPGFVAVFGVMLRTSLLIDLSVVKRNFDKTVRSGRKRRAGQGRHQQIGIGAEPGGRGSRPAHERP